MFKRSTPFQSSTVAPKPPLSDVASDYDIIMPEVLAKELEPQGFSSLKVAMGFAIMGLVGALFLTPLLSNGAAMMGVITHSEYGIDTTVVGSVKKSTSPQVSPDETRSYILRRSVLQKDPTIDCIIYEDGTQEGGC